MMYKRIFALAAVGVLALGVAACGKSNKPADPAAKPPPPDRASCKQGTSMAEAVGVSIAELKQSLESNTSSAVILVQILPDFVNNATRVKGEVTDARVKAVVEGYQTDLEQLKKTLEESPGDQAQQLAAFDATIAKFETSSQNLSALCAEALAALSPERVATCEKINNTSMLLFGAFMELDAAGTDQAKINVAAPKFLSALDNVIAELNRVAEETKDSELKAALAHLISDLGTFRQAMAAAGTDRAKLDAALYTDAYDAGQEKVNALCEE